MLFPPALKQNKEKLEQLVKKWQPLLESEKHDKIDDHFKKYTTAVILENTETAFLNEANSSSAAINVSANFGGPNSNNTTNISSVDPIMINLVRRAVPNLIAYDICGVQPMTMPTGLIFALRTKYVNGNSPGTMGNEALYNEANSGWSGQGTPVGANPGVLNQSPPGAYAYGTGMSTIDGERLGTTAGTPFKEMGFTIEKVSVTAQTRALKAEYTTELAQDLKNVHGLDAETELANILSTEILAEINREVIRTIYTVAKPGAQNPDLGTPGTFDLDTDSNGRWAVEKFKGLLFQIDRDANVIARETRRGRGNIIICSSDVASAFSAAGVLDFAPALQSATNLQVDDTGNTFAGILNGKYKVYIDPYADPYADGEENNFYVVGYRGSSPLDAGIFYCPYVPLEMAKAVGTDSFQPKIAFKTRYGMVANPFANGISVGLGALTPNTNVYFRRVRVTSLTGAAS